MTQQNRHDSAQIDVSLVRRLIGDQFPAWAHLPIKPVRISGHDNRTFHLGEEMSVRLPIAQPYAAHVKTEHLWLPKLAQNLPQPIPTPLGMGEPGHGYPWQWSVNAWLAGEDAATGRIDDLNQFAGDLANFLNALRSIDTNNAPAPGLDNFFRGGELAVYDTETRACIDELRDVVDVSAATDLWESALDAKWSGLATWVHGDVAAGNLLVKDGRLSGVIDFGQLAAGDPACDVTIAWTFLTGASREVFRSQLSVNQTTWLRGRGWGLWKALLELRRYRQTDPVESTRAKRVLDDILSDQVL